jgi:FAD dependent oxidoreductase TIGR03364
MGDRVAPYDLAVVGAGIVGLAHALAAARRGKRVVVIDRDAQANEASVRNFGFITVTGQEAGETWRRATRSRDVWREVAPAAGIPILHAGSLVVARSPEALAVLEEFMATPMAAGCRLLAPREAAERFPVVRAEGVEGALWSPHELRVEPRRAIPLLATYLEQAHGVTFLRDTLVRAVAPPRLATSAGPIEAEACIVCPGNDFLTLFPERIAAYALERCKLHMLRLAPQPAGWRLPGAVMTDASLARYLGWAALPAAAVLRARIAREAPDVAANGVHLIVVQSADGSLVVGDSHHYAATPDPFAPAEVEGIILRLLHETLLVGEPAVVERWLGVYPWARDRSMLIDRPEDAVRIVLVTSGTGMSTAFAIAEEVVGELYDPGPH